MGSDTVSEKDVLDSHSNLDLSHWAFGSLRAPQEVADLLPDISLMPENSFTYDHYMMVDGQDLQGIEKDPEVLQSLAKWFNSVDINYLDIKEPEYICHKDLTKPSEFKPLNPLASRVIDTWEAQYPKLKDITFPPPPPTETEPLTLLSEAIDTCDNPLDPAVKLSESVFKFLSKEFSTDPDTSVDQQFTDLQRPDLDKASVVAEKPTVSLREAHLKQFVQFLEIIIDFSNSMTEANRNEDMDLLFFSDGLKIISISTLNKIEKHINRIVKNKSIEDVDRSLLSSLFQLLYNNITRAECTIIINLNTEAKMEDLEAQSETMKQACSIAESGMLASRLCLLMANNLVTMKTLFSENIIGSSLQFLRNILSYGILPGLEVLSEEFNISRYPNLKPGFEKLVSNIAPRLSKLALSISNYGNEFVGFIKENELSFEIVIKLLFITLSALFSDLSGGHKNAIFSVGASSNFKKRFQSVLQTVFVLHPDQREWIVEEVLTSLIKLPSDKRSQKSFRLIDGKKMHIATAIILQLVQSSTEKTIATKFSSESQYQSLVADNFSANSESFPFVVDLLISGCQSGIEETSKVIGPVLTFMFSRVSKGKGPNEAEYKFLLDMMVEDSLNVLNYPEWPAAELFLRGLCNILVSHLDDASTEAHIKVYAIDYLGLVAARLKKNSIDDITKRHRELLPDSDSHDIIPALSKMPEKIDPDTPILLIKSMWNCFEDLANYLLALSVEDSSNECARQLHFCAWGLYFGDAYLLAMTSDAEDNIDLPSWGVNIKAYLKQCLGKLISISYNPAKPDSLKTADLLTTSNRELLYLLNEAMSVHRPLFLNFDLILTRILTLMESSTPSHRNRSLRALGSILEEDHASIVLPKVQNAITLRLQDTAASVRAVAVDLVGRCITLRPEISTQCYSAISERILDTSLAVRKCVIRIMKELSLKVTDKTILADICSRLLGRTLDVEVTARENSTKTLQDIWFSNLEHLPFTIDDNLFSEQDSIKYELLPLAAQKEMMERAQIIINVVSTAGNNASTDQLLSNFITKSLEKSENSKSEATLKRWAYISAVAKLLLDCFFRHLLKLENSQDKSSLCSTMKTLVSFGATRGLSIPAIHLTALEPYFRASAEPIEQMMMYYVLKIYNMTLPDLEDPNKTQLKSIEELLIASLPKVSTTVLSEAVLCVCLISTILISRYGKIFKVYFSCINKLKADKLNVEKNLPVAIPKNTIRLVLIAGLLCQNIDKFKYKDPSSTVINTDDILNELYEIVTAFLLHPVDITIQTAALQGLGYILIGYPKLFMKKHSLKILLDSFNSEHEILKAKLLTILGDFLASEASQGKPKDEVNEECSEVDMQVLTGRSEEFQSASISSHVIQNLLPSIIGCLMGGSQDLKIKALHVVSLVLEQGHVNPALCAPALIALQSDESKTIQKNAIEISQKIASKFSSLFYSKNIEAMRLTFEYQQKAHSTDLKGYRTVDNFPLPQAILHNFYESIQPSLQRRKEFFKVSIKLFDFELESNENKVDVDFLRFVAENLSMLDYKSPMELAPLLSMASKGAMATGANVVHYLENNGEKEMDLKRETILVRAAYGIVCLLALKLNLQFTYGLHNSKAFKEKSLTRVSTHNPVNYWEKVKFFDKITDARHQLNEFLQKDSLSYTHDPDSAVDHTPPKDKTKKSAPPKLKRKPDTKRVESDTESVASEAQDEIIDVMQ